eukprot:8366953-Pyramimonas_sp.AAC.1
MSERKAAKEASRCRLAPRNRSPGTKYATTMITLPRSRCQTIGTKPKKGGGRPAAMHARRCPSNVVAAN